MWTQISCKDNSILFYYKVAVSEKKCRTRTPDSLSLKFQGSSSGYRRLKFHRSDFSEVCPSHSYFIFADLDRIIQRGPFSLVKLNYLTTSSNISFKDWIYFLPFLLFQHLYCPSVVKINTLESNINEKIWKPYVLIAASESLGVLLCGEIFSHFIVFQLFKVLIVSFFI